MFTNVTTRTYREGSTDDVVDDRRQTRGPKRKNTDSDGAFDAFDAFERDRAFRRATIRESSVFSGPGAATRGAQYVPTPSAAANAGGRGVCRRDTRSRWPGKRPLSVPQRTAPPSARARRRSRREAPERRADDEKISNGFRYVDYYYRKRS